eukprot:921284-Pleurochrysis_carterae.AAC.1
MSPPQQHTPSPFPVPCASDAHNEADASIRDKENSTGEGAAPTQSLGAASTHASLQHSCTSTLVAQHGQRGEESSANAREGTAPPPQQTPRESSLADTTADVVASTHGTADAPAEPAGQALAAAEPHASLPPAPCSALPPQPAPPAYHAEQPAPAPNASQAHAHGTMPTPPLPPQSPTF